MPCGPIAPIIPVYIISYTVHNTKERPHGGRLPFCPSSAAGTQEAPASCSELSQATVEGNIRAWQALGVCLGLPALQPALFAAPGALTAEGVHRRTPGTLTGPASGASAGAATAATLTAAAFERPLPAFAAEAVACLQQPRWRTTCLPR